MSDDIIIQQNPEEQAARAEKKPNNPNQTNWVRTLAKKDLTPEEFDAFKKDAQWQRTLQRLGIAEATITEVRPSDIAWLAEHWQFLQVIESGGEKKPFDKPQFIEAQSGWTIINYGDAMCTSPGKYLFGSGYFRTSTGDDEGGGIVNPKKGTIFKQAFDSAAEIIRLAQEFGWAGVQIVDGHPSMQRAAWVESCRIGVRMDGYTADMDAERKRRRIVSATLDEMHAALRGTW